MNRSLNAFTIAHNYITYFVQIKYKTRKLVCQFEMINIVDLVKWTVIFRLSSTFFLGRQVYQENQNISICFSKHTIIDTNYATLIYLIHLLLHSGYLHAKLPGHCTSAYFFLVMSGIETLIASTLSLASHLSC